MLGTSFYNADIIEQIAVKSGMFSVVLRQKRTFTNRFGESIREDVLNLAREANMLDETLPCRVGRAVARTSLDDALKRVPESNRAFLVDAIDRLPSISGTPIFGSANYADYHTRDFVMMVKENQGDIMSAIVPTLPTPHLDKLGALLGNPRLPSAEKPRVEEAIKRYHQWIKALGGAGQEQAASSRSS